MDGKRTLQLCLLVFACSLLAKPLFAQPPSPRYERSHHYNLLNQFYQQKPHYPYEAEKTLRKLLQHNPNDVHALKEMGYLLLEQKRNSEALMYFQRASYLAPTDYHLHQQLGYLYNQLNRNREAYYQFADAAESPDPEIQQQSRQAMASLSGAQTQFLPNPYFADIFISPYYLSRFQDYIMPWEARAGVEYGDYDEWKIYALFQGNRDSQSTIGEVPIIFFDNYTMLGAGTEYRFFQLPIWGYLEYGKSYEVYPIDDEPWWQNDFRTGVYSYIEWGATPAYNDEFTLGYQQTGDFYGLFGYYSRYDHDWIGQFRVREGIRAMQYAYSSIDFYLKAEWFVDTKQIYYNNIIQGGPGMLFIPDNRWPIELRVEGLRGKYIPTPDSNENPFDKLYNTLLLEVDIYFSF